MARGEVPSQGEVLVQPLALGSGGDAPLSASGAVPCGPVRVSVVAIVSA